MTEQPIERKGMSLKTRVKIVVGIVLAVLAVIIMFQNTTPVNATILFWQRDVSLVVLLVAMLFIGFVLGMVSITMHKKRRPKER